MLLLPNKNVSTFFSVIKSSTVSVKRLISSSLTIKQVSTRSGAVARRTENSPLAVLLLVNSVSGYPSASYSTVAKRLPCLRFIRRMLPVTTSSSVSLQLTLLQVLLQTSLLLVAFPSLPIPTLPSRLIT